MLDILRRSPLLRLEGNRTVQLHNIRPLTRTLAGLLEASVAASADGQVAHARDVVGEAAEANGLLLPGMSRKPVAIVFGPENGSISEGLVYGAAKEAAAKDYTHLYCIGFAIEPNARQLIQSCEEVMGIPATYVQATMDLNMGDLLKNMRSSQIFSVCGLPEIAVSKLAEWPVSGGTAWPGCLRPDLDGEPSFQGRRCAGLAARYGLQRHVLPRDAGVLSANERLGRAEESAQSRLRSKSLGSSCRRP